MSKRRVLTEMMAEAKPPPKGSVPPDVVKVQKEWQALVKVATDAYKALDKATAALRKEKARSDNIEWTSAKGYLEDSIKTIEGASVDLETALYKFPKRKDLWKTFD
jgi:hypothetical protein